MHISASLVLYHNFKKDVLSVLNCAIDSVIESIIVIDQSDNDYYRFITNMSSKIVYIHNKNMGYGGGHNLAVRILKSDSDFDFHVVLNPDVIFSGSCIDGLCRYMNSDERIGLVMPKVYYPNGELQYLCKLLPTPIDVLFRYLFNGKYFISFYNRLILLSSGYDTQMNVPYLSGCFMFLRMRAFADVNGFDERYFMHFEDLDLTRRIHQKYKTMFFPDEKIIHAHAAGQRKSVRILFISIVSAIKYFNKWGWLFDSERRRVNNKTLKEAMKIKSN